MKVGLARPTAVKNPVSEAFQHVSGSSSSVAGQQQASASAKLAKKSDMADDDTALGLLSLRTAAFPRVAPTHGSLGDRKRSRTDTGGLQTEAVAQSDESLATNSSKPASVASKLTTDANHSSSSDDIRKGDPDQPATKRSRIDDAQPNSQDAPASLLSKPAPMDLAALEAAVDSLPTAEEVEMQFIAALARDRRMGTKGMSPPRFNEICKESKALADTFAHLSKELGLSKSAPGWGSIAIELQAHACRMYGMALRCVLREDEALSS